MRKRDQNLNNLLSHWHYIDDEDVMFEHMLSNDLRKFHTHW
jgi:hypothetical protein